MIRVFAAALVVLPTALIAASDYAGQEARAISSLSSSDVAAIEAGEGWGLAKPAELNGWPGPRHVLDEAEALGLTAEQRREIQAIFEEMRSAAIDAGAAYIEAEAALDAAFRSGEADDGLIATLSEEAGAAHAVLRAVHLAAHLRTKPLLSAEQTRRYQFIRGYAADGAHHGRAHGHSHEE